MERIAEKRLVVKGVGGKKGMFRVEKHPWGVLASRACHGVEEGGVLGHLGIWVRLVVDLFCKIKTIQLNRE